MKSIEQSRVLYSSLIFDEDGFWDSEQFEDLLPIQFWREEVPDQEYLDVLLKAWHDVDVDVSLTLGDPNNFDAVVKRVRSDEKYWLVWWSGNMSVRKIEPLENMKPLPILLDYYLHNCLGVRDSAVVKTFALTPTLSHEKDAW